MTFNRIKKTASIIGLYEIISGSLGLGLLLFTNLEATGFFVWTIGLKLIMIAFFVLNIYAGWSLVKLKKEKIIYSEIVQIIQLPIIGIGAFHFALSLGIIPFIGIDYTQNFSLKIDLEFIPSYFGIGVNNNTSSAYFFVNLIPILILTYLGRLKNNLTTKTITP